MARDIEHHVLPEGRIERQIHFRFVPRARLRDDALDDGRRAVGDTLHGMTVYGGGAGASHDDPGVNGNGTVFAIPLPN